ncbi:MAG TPA: hypothetical protein VFW59_02550 [Gallionella sp.]|nr:hypothetical protein [Gallionella sp.]
MNDLNLYAERLKIHGNFNMTTGAMHKNINTTYWRIGRFLLRHIWMLGVVLALGILFFLYKLLLLGTLFLSASPASVNNDWNAIGSAGDWTSALATIAGFLFLGYQLRREQQVLEVQTSAQVYGSGIDVLKLFIENHELRPYFYDCKPSPEKFPDDGAWDRVMTACEIMCDQFESFYSSQNSLNNEVSAIWVRYMCGIYLTSPSLRYFLVQEGYRYDDDFIGVFNCNLHGISTRTRERIENLARETRADTESSNRFVLRRHDLTLEALAELQSRQTNEQCTCTRCAT